MEHGFLTEQSLTFQAPFPPQLQLLFGSGLQCFFLGGVGVEMHREVWYHHYRQLDNENAIKNAHNIP